MIQIFPLVVKNTNTCFLLNCKFIILFYYYFFFWLIQMYFYFSNGKVPCSSPSEMVCFLVMNKQKTTVLATRIPYLIVLLYTQSIYSLNNQNKKKKMDSIILFHKRSREIKLLYFTSLMAVN